MNEAKVNEKVDKIFDAWGLGEFTVNGDDDIKSAIRSAIRETYIKGYEKGFKKCEKAIDKAKKSVI
jgi:agmatine/peptidylarginine deiminase